uniref:Uncharacterized protein n=1 Tax=Candidatus Kentrum sp. TUN TaxID=2126343 RepID=A0A451AMK6_9GAMM|nr:MAG: hypothetical protein BECKTUN1418F_GA0071002_11398 [Candidatus Kentron sp. TUN]VFK62859.1 MAG: hypothetical protein BECKTUN1418D_GA0071000_11892 [Candidatus Kentron sp. TUN]VFK67270.1 MAG: hypothetical protein BECKTUN1418E_GA0071001_11397 [Candidatus Kentron sp. TUN]
MMRCVFIVSTWHGIRPDGERLDSGPFAPQNLLFLVRTQYNNPRSTWGNKRSVSQLPVDRRHDHIEKSALVNTILDRLIHNTNRLPLQSESMQRPVDQSLFDLPDTN